MTQTLAILKPDVTSRGLYFKILDTIGKHSNLVNVAMEARWLTTEQAKEFYAEHKGKDFFDRHIKFMTSGPCLGMKLEGDRAVEVWRELLNDIRKMFEAEDYSENTEKNLVHGSDSEESAAREIAFWFGELN